MLNEIWFVLLTVLLAGYAILDGFDLGVGILHLFSRKEEHRRVIMNAIGPVWDGNEVWLLTFGGALFAAFRIAYATVFSAFYTALMLVLCTLIFRAASLEFRSKVESPAWRATWDFVFSLSSFLAALLFGVAVGNVLVGLPIEDLVYKGSFFSLLNPFSVLVGLMTVALFALHGALFLRIKASGELEIQAERWITLTHRAFVILFILVTVQAIITVPHARVSWGSWLVLPLNICAIAAIRPLSKTGRPHWAFVASGVNVLLLVVNFAASMFPNLLISSLGAQHNVTIYNGANSQKTLGIMFGIVCVGFPLVLLYTAWVYWLFRGKVRLDKHSY